MNSANEIPPFTFDDRVLPNLAVRRAAVNEQNAPIRIQVGARSLTAPKETQSLTFAQRGPEKVAVQKADVNEQTATGRIQVGFVA